MPYTHDGPPLYLAEDQTTVVAADDPRASYLLVAPGGTLPDATAKHYGLPRLVASEPEPEPEPEPEKAAAPKANKLRAGTPSNKAQE